MFGEQKLSIDFLERLLYMTEASRDFALSKLEHVTRDQQIEEYSLMRDDAMRRIFQIQACINWIRSLSQKITV